MVQKTARPWPAETLDMCEYCSHWLLLPSLWQDGVPIAVNCWHEEISPLSFDISREPCLWKVTSHCWEEIGALLQHPQVRGGQHQRRPAAPRLAHLHTNRYLLPEESIGSTGVLKYHVKAARDAWQLSCIAVYCPLMGPCSWSLTYPKYCFSYRKLCMGHNQCLKKMVQVSYIFSAI